MPRDFAKLSPAVIFEKGANKLNSYKLWFFHIFGLLLMTLTLRVLTLKFRCTVPNVRAISRGRYRDFSEKNLEEK